MNLLQPHDPLVVKLHVWELQPDANTRAQLQQQQSQPSATDRALLLVSGLLPSIGMGAYHSSLEVMGLKYTFVGNAGVMVGQGMDTGLPPMVSGQPNHSIILGRSRLTTKAQLAQVVQCLSQLFYTAQSYDVCHRNCNHFTETLATALLTNFDTNNTNHDATPPARLAQYPRWVNRLASTGALAMTNGSHTAAANILDEARLAAGY